MANARVTRNIEDRLQERVDAVRETREEANLTDIQKRERAAAFRDKWVNEALPEVPVIPGFHTCWLSTTNKYDSIDKRMSLGYEPVKAADIAHLMGGSSFDALGKMSSGKFEGCISCNEMILFKIPDEIYQEVMKLLHFDDPNDFTREILNKTRGVQQEIGRNGGRTILEGGLLELEKEANRVNPNHLRFD
jgi:hypothetical protein